MAVAIREVVTARDRNLFIRLPAKINRNHAGWLPPLYGDEKKYFNPEKNPSFRSCDHRQVIAYKDGRPAGRIMGVINHSHNSTMGLANARFCFLECENDRDVAHALISDIETWGKQKGMTKIIGPFAFSDRDIQGMLVEGFEYEPVVDSANNAPYLPKLVEAEGYVKEIDCVIERRLLSEPLPEIFERLYQRVVSKKAFQFLEFTKRKQLKQYIIPVLRMVNESFSKIYGFVPMDEVEMMDLAKRYLPLLDPRFVKIALKNGSVAAFMVTMPNPYRGLQKARGHLFPFGIFHILHAMRHATSCNTMLGAVHPDCQKQGLDIFLGYTTIRTAREAGMTSVDSHVVMEKNDDMSSIFSRYGAKLIKRFRVYQKSLNA